jgi:hypothetical protein
MPSAKLFCLPFVLAFSFFLAACNLQTTTPIPGVKSPTPFQPAPSQPTSPTIAPDEETVATAELSEINKAPDFPADINPLTGLRVDDISVLDRRPVAVKISNYPRSIRPQWGLSLADIVYEYYHNNDLTRFYAIFYSQDAPLAGPIRSGRIFDSYLTTMYESILTFASADSRVLERLNGEHPIWQLVPLLEGSNCPPRPVCRFEPGTRNYLLASTEAVRDYSLGIGGNNRRPNLQGMVFGTDIPPGGDAVNEIYLYYSYSAYAYWQYDPESGRYLRFQDTQEDFLVGGERYRALTDRLNGRQVAADNVVVLYVPHFHFFYQAGSDILPEIEVVDMDFSGHAPAFLFRDGHAYALEWVIEEGSVLYLIDANGDRFPLKPGTTWFQVMNEENRLIQAEDFWRFEFIFDKPEQ